MSLKKKFETDLEKIKELALRVPETDADEARDAAEAMETVISMFLALADKLDRIESRLARGGQSL